MNEKSSRDDRLFKIVLDGKRPITEDPQSGRCDIRRRRRVYAGSGRIPVFAKRALNCWPWVRSLIHSPDAVIHSPAETMAAWPTTVTRSRCPRAFVSQNAEPVIGIVERHTLDQAGQNLSVRRWPERVRRPIFHATGKIRRHPVRSNSANRSMNRVLRSCRSRSAFR